MGGTLLEMELPEGVGPVRNMFSAKCVRYKRRGPYPTPAYVLSNGRPCDENCEAHAHKKVAGYFYAENDSNVLLVGWKRKKEEVIFSSFVDICKLLIDGSAEKDPENTLLYLLVPNDIGGEHFPDQNHLKGLVKLLQAQPSESIRCSNSQSSAPLVKFVAIEKTLAVARSFTGIKAFLLRFLVLPELSRGFDGWAPDLAATMVTIVETGSAKLLYSTLGWTAKGPVWPVVVFVATILPKLFCFLRKLVGNLPGIGTTRAKWASFIAIVLLWLLYQHTVTTLSILLEGRVPNHFFQEWTHWFDETDVLWGWSLSELLPNAMILSKDFSKQIVWLLAKFRDKVFPSSKDDTALQQMEDGVFVAAERAMRQQHLDPNNVGTLSGKDVTNLADSFVTSALIVARGSRLWYPDALTQLDHLQRRFREITLDGHTNPGIWLPGGSLNRTAYRFAAPELGIDLEYLRLLIYAFCDWGNAALDNGRGQTTRPLPSDRAPKIRELPPGAFERRGWALPSKGASHAMEV